MKKQDILAGFIIGGISALILPGVPVFSDLFELVGKYFSFFPYTLPFLAIAGLYIAELLSKKIPTIFQIAKGFLVGIANSAIDLKIFDFLLVGSFGQTRGIYNIIFKTISFSCGTINSYIWNKFWTFKKRKTKEKGKEFTQFFGVSLIGLLIHVTVIHVVINIIGPQFGITPRVWATIGNMAAVFIGFAWNFTGYKFIVFKK